MFSYGKNYSTPFCEHWKDDQCARNIFENRDGRIENNFTKKVDSKCKHSCTILQYSGLEVLDSPIILPQTAKLQTRRFRYQFGNADNKMKSFQEYLIYDSMAMIGSVGGTFGMFIGFSMTGVISSIIEFFKETKIGRNIVV